MGAVYVAEDLARTERVAIKLAHSEHLAIDVIDSHMAREIQIGHAVRHPNVVSTFGGGCEAGQSFVVMELAPGYSLGTLAAERRLSIRRVSAIGDQILAGLAAVHDAGYLHGDMKTDNVLVTYDDNGGDLVKIIDFGLACDQRKAVALDDEHVISGTPQYLAPELALGQPKSVASELYAVGVILYELLTGAPPFAGGGVLEVMRKQVEDEIIPPSLKAPELNLSLALERVVMRALSKAPGDRYASAPEFRAALRAATSTSRDSQINAVMSTTGPTLEWTRPELPPARPRAVGTRPPGVRSASRNPVVIVEAALDATRTHVAAHRLGAARDELEAALHLLDDDPSGDRVAWRLLLALSAVCDGLRDPVHARRIARLALDSAARARSDVGRRRAKALIERFAGRS